MAKISINLLPQEVTQTQIKQEKSYKIRLMWVAMLMFMIFLSSLAVALQILQSGNFLKAQSNLKKIEEKVISLKGREVSSVILKNRLSAIDQLIATPSKQVITYHLIESLIPPSFIVSSLDVDSSGTITMSLVTTDSVALDNFVASVISSEKNEGKIASVEIESLSRGRDYIYRTNLKIKSK